MRIFSTSTYLLWGCFVAIALWILITMKLSSRVSQSEYQGKFLTFFLLLKFECVFIFELGIEFMFYNQYKLR
jgi:hypothetical protein